jgi:anti-sigma factor RsiW
MGNIIQLHGEEHHQAQLLLPWFVSGKLDGEDRARFEAHLANCPECQGELGLELRLQAEVASLPVEVEHAWTSLQARLQHRPRPLAKALAWLSQAGRTVGRKLHPARPWLGWACAAALGLVLAVGPAVQKATQAGRYHALSAPSSRPLGDIVVVFRPDATELSIRQALKQAHARLTDGPTAGDAYMLEAPLSQRAAALASLRAQKAVMLAEPIDDGEAP